jgi:hypothetical protein
MLCREEIMTRNLYRLYLYIVVVALLVFMMVIFGQVLQTLLNFTPLRDSYTAVPSRASVIQSLVLALASWVIAGALGGLHYWLIRRDMHNDPTAGTSAIRSFFLNIPEGIAVILTIFTIGFQIIDSYARNMPGGIVGSLAFAIPTLLLALLLELERRRASTLSGLALTFRRLHLYGVQFFLLIFLIAGWLQNLRPLVDGLLFGGQGLLQDCRSSMGGYCPSYNMVGLLASLLWFTGCWFGYGWLARGDASSRLRLIMHLVSFAGGVGFFVWGLYVAFELLLSPLFHRPVTISMVTGPSASFDFFSTLTLGTLIIGIYHLWLRNAVTLKLIGSDMLASIENAIAAGGYAVSFWWGLGLLLLNLLNTLLPVGNVPDAQAWDSALAFAVVGLVYIPLEVVLARRSATEAAQASEARRVYVLILLAAGILALAIGGATALYAWVTALLGSPITSWQQAAYAGLAAFVVGMLLIGIYLTQALRGHLFSGLRKHSPATLTQESMQPVPSSTETVEHILDELLAGQITRDVAAARIHALLNIPSSAKH